MINSLNLSVHDLQITISPDKKSAETEFTLYARGNGGKAGSGFQEAFDCTAKLIKDSENQWLFHTFSGKPVVTRSQSKWFALGGNFKRPAKFDWKKIVDEMKMVVLCVATLWVTTKNAPFSDRDKSFQTFLKTFEIAS